MLKGRESDTRTQWYRTHTDAAMTATFKQRGKIGPQHMDVLLSSALSHLTDRQKDMLVILATTHGERFFVLLLFDLRFKAAKLGLS